MKKTIFGLALFTLMGFGFHQPPATQLRCLIQLTNYGGEGAYVAVSVVDAKGKYIKTLNISGDDPEWFSGLEAWFDYFIRADEKIDAVTGASIASGGRKIALIDLEDGIVDNGYKLRFETSVEDQLYHKQDVEVPLNSELIGQTIEGSGYIRFVKIIK